MTRAAALTLALLAGAARAEDGGAPEGVVLEVVSGVVTVRGGEVLAIDAGIYLDDTAAVRVARELVAARAELAVRRDAGVAPAAIPAAVTVVGAICLLAGFAAGLLVK